MTALLLSVSAPAAGIDVQASYGNGTVTVSTQGLAADTLYHLISVQKRDTVVALKSGNTDGSGAMTVQIPTGALENGSYQVYIYKNEDGSVAVSSSFTVQSASGGGSGSSGSSGSSYGVTANSSENGTVTVSAKNADRGDTVTVIVKPDSGYELDSITVKEADGSTVKLTDKGNGQYTFIMPASKVTVDAGFVKSDQPNTINFENVSVKAYYADVSANAYYADAVAWAVQKGITSGTTATTFSPNADCTRAQTVTFLWRAAGSPKVPGSNPFSDVSVNEYYYDAVLWAVENGITSGTSATTFAPDTAVSRAQTVTFLYRASGSPVISGSGFSDVSGDAYYANAVAWAAQKGITSGTTATTFSPNADCTRAQIVTFLYRDYQGK